MLSRTRRPSWRCGALLPAPLSRRPGARAAGAGDGAFREIVVEARCQFSRCVQPDAIGQAGGLVPGVEGAHPGASLESLGHDARLHRLGPAPPARGACHHLQSFDNLAPAGQQKMRAFLQGCGPIHRKSGGEWINRSANAPVRCSRRRLRFSDASTQTTLILPQVLKASRWGIGLRYRPLIFCQHGRPRPLRCRRVFRDGGEPIVCSGAATFDAKGGKRPHAGAALPPLHPAQADIRMWHAAKRLGLWAGSAACVARWKPPLLKKSASSDPVSGCCLSGSSGHADVGRCLLPIAPPWDMEG
jgi:hypothetical protein